MWGVLVAASGMALACKGVQQGGDYEIPPGQKRTPAQAGYNGTIQDIPTSIDPRTPETDGTPGRSLEVDLGTQRMEGSGSGTGGMADDAAAYGGSGEVGSAQGPTRESPSGNPDTDGQQPDARNDTPDAKQQTGKQQRTGGK
jgi:hypothetical protein